MHAAIAESRDSFACESAASERASIESAFRLLFVGETVPVINRFLDQEQAKPFVA